MCAPSCLTLFDPMNYSLLGSSVRGLSQARILEQVAISRASLVAQTVKRLPTMWGTLVQPLGREDLLEKEMATHSSILTQKIPWMKESSRLQSMGSQRVGHD